MKRILRSHSDYEKVARKQIILFTFFTFLLGTIITTHAQTFQWAKSLNSTLSGSGSAIELDASGNVFTTGSFRDTADFNPGTGIYNLISAGKSDIFISKLDAGGNFIWAEKMGGKNYDYSKAIVVDVAGNIYITGAFQDTADFDPGMGAYNLISAGGTDIFVIKLSANGNLIWAKRMGGLSDDEGASIAVDASGNVYITGFFKGTADFDPSVNTYNLISAGFNDIFISKLDVNGNLLWAKRMGGSGIDVFHFDDGFSIALDAIGNVYTTGRFADTADFDPGIGIYNLIANGGDDIFISKLNSNGNFIWAKQLGGNLYDEGHAITVDANGNVYTTGEYQQAGMFISKFDTDGNIIWMKEIPHAYGLSIAVDTSGNVYTTGNFGAVFSGDTVDFDPGPGIYNLICPGGDGSNLFISKLDASGNFIWAKGIGDFNVHWGESSSSIKVDLIGYIYITGAFSDTVDFNPPYSDYLYNDNGEFDIFVAKYGNTGAGILEHTLGCIYLIYPNPSTERFMVEISQFNIDDAIYIYNLQGQLLLHQPIQQVKTEINISNFDKGVYFVRVLGTDISMTKIIIKE